MQQLQAMTERLKDPEKRGKHNMQERQRLKDPSSREKHNSYVLKKYITLALTISFRYLKVQLLFVLAVDVFISGDLLLF